MSDAEKILDQADTIDVETGADLQSGTKIGTNAAVHGGNDVSTFDSDLLDGKEASALQNQYTTATANNVYPNTLGLKAWWDLTFGSGSTAYDYDTVGQPAWGEIKSGCTWATDGLSFDGSSSARVPIHNHVYDTAGQIDGFTVVARVNIGAVSSANIITAWDRSEYFRLAIASDGTLHLGLTDSGGTTVDTTSTATFDDGADHLVAGVYDPSVTNDTKLYADGAFDTEVDNYASGTSLGTGTTRYGFLGCNSEAKSFDGSNGGANFNGTLKEVRLYHRALSAAELDDIWNGIA